jgi:hypothetical protein
MDEEALMSVISRLLAVSDERGRAMNQANARAALARLLDRKVILELIEHRLDGRALVQEQLIGSRQDATVPVLMLLGDKAYTRLPKPTSAGAIHFRNISISRESRITGQSGI